jgi:hypothetical protein
MRPDECHVVIGCTTDGKRLQMHVEPTYPDRYWEKGVPGRFLETCYAAGVDVIVICGQRRVVYTRNPELWKKFKELQEKL